MRARAIGLLLLLLLLAPAALAKPAPLFAGHDVVRIRIVAPVTSLFADRTDTDKRINGTLSLAGDAGEPHAITLGLRGNKRRQREICSFPPMELAFATKLPKESLFRGQSKLKLVTHCRTTPAFEQQLLLEYAAYRIYNAITPASFAVRLVMIDYVDEKGRETASRPGILIEDTADMADRNKQREIRERERIVSSRFDPEAAVRFALFQEMISNLDWGMNGGPPGTNCCHNSRPIGRKGATEGLIPVPYDFDYSGLVDAPYAVPPEGFSESNVRQRRYRGFCRHNAHVKPAVDKLLSHRDAILAAVRDTPMLEDRPRNRAIAYIEAYLQALSSQPDVAAARAKTCL